MASPCRVEFIATPDDLSVHIYESRNRNRLLFADEDERAGIAALVHRVWRFIRTRDITGIDLRFVHDISYAYRRELAGWIRWLLRGGRAPR